MSRKIRKRDVERVRETKCFLSAEPWGMGSVYWLSDTRPKITEGELDFRDEQGWYTTDHRIVSKEFAKIVFGEENLDNLPELFIAEVKLTTVATVQVEGGVFTDWKD